MHPTVLRENCVRALRCLYAATEESVADDVNKQVYAYVKHLESRPRPRSLLSTMVMIGLIGYVGADLFKTTAHAVTVVQHESFGDCQPLVDRAEQSVREAEQCVQQRKSTLETIMNKVVG